jgi:AcrR family transcriptional regulator
MVQQRLLDIAIREFSLKGLEGASTREIAAAAGTVMSSITYHYGGKEGLYLATADYIAEQMGRGMAEAPVEAAGTAEPTPAEARRALHDLLDRFVVKMMDEQTAGWSLFIVREQTNPTEAFERIWRGMMGRMMERVVDLVCIASGRRDAKVARVTAITLLGQIIVLRAARASCLKLLQVADFEPDDIAALRARVAANIDATLDTLTAERQEPQ